MNKSLFEKTEGFVVDAFDRAGKPTDVYHAQRTAYWIGKLKPDADEALFIAGLAHDIERAFHGDWKKGSSDRSLLQKHQDLSATEIKKFFKKEKVKRKIIKRIVKLVSHHEEGGDEDQDILCDADCLAYFEEKAIRNAKKYKREGKIDEMKKKLDYVYGRIHSSDAKQIALRWYNEAKEELEKY